MRKEEKGVIENFLFLNSNSIFIFCDFALVVKLKNEIKSLIFSYELILKELFVHFYIFFFLLDGWFQRPSSDIRLYPTREDFLTAWSDAIANAVEGGFLLEADVAELEASAETWSYPY